MATNYEILIADKRTNGSIRNAINNDRVPAVWVVQQAEAFIYERLRVREMLTSAQGALQPGDSSMPLPPRYRGWRDFRFTGASPGYVALRDPSTVRAAWSYDEQGARSTGQPCMAYTEGTVARFDKVCDQPYTWDLLYYQALAPLNSGTNTSNVLTERAARALFMACLAFANEWFKEQNEKTYYLGLAEAEIALLNQQGEMEAGGFDERVIAV